MWAYADLAKSTADSQKLIGLPRNTYCYSVAFSADGKQVAVACEDSAVRLYDAQSLSLIHISRQPLAVIDLNGAWVMGLAFSPDGCCLATASVDKGAADRTHTEIWGIATRKRLLSLPNRQPSDAVQFTPDGKKIVVAGRDNRCLLYTSRCV